MRESIGSSRKKGKKQNLLKPLKNKNNIINSNNLITNLSSSNSSNISNISGSSGQRKNLINNNSIFLNDFVDVGEDDYLNESTIGVTSKKRNLKQEKEADEQKRAVAADLGGGSWLAKILGWNKPKVPKANVKGLDKIRYANKVNIDYFNFDKNRAYKKDAELQYFRSLLHVYNNLGGTTQQEIDLMQFAADYIRKHSTGTTAKHKGRTEMMEDVLYQLTMQGGTMEKADKGIENAKKKIWINPLSPLQAADLTYATTEKEKQDIINNVDNKYTDHHVRQEEAAKVRQNLNALQNVYRDKKFSKSLQMIAADVMSRSGSLSQIKAQCGGGGYRDTERGGEIDSRINLDLNSRMASNFHEFTHMADSETFENAMAAAISPDATDQEIRNLALENSEKALKLFAVTNDDSARDYQTGGSKYQSYVLGSDIKNADLEKSGGGRRGPEYLRKQKKGTEAIKRLFPHGFLENGDPNNSNYQGFQTLNEYDAVTNELFIKYELEHNEKDRKNSQAYRLLKSMAIDSHVRRRIEDLKKRRKQKG